MDSVIEKLSNHFNINPVKLSVQQGFILDWMKVKNGTACMATGCGKSFIGVIISSIMLEKKPNNKIVIVTPKIAIAQQWENDYVKILKQVYPEATIDVFVVNSVVLTDKIKERYNLAIYDEVHRYLNGVEFSKAFDVISAPANLCLSATLSSDEKKILQSKGQNILINIARPEAEKLGLIKPVRCVNVLLDMSLSELMEYRRWEDVINKNVWRFNRYSVVDCLRSSYKTVEMAREWGVDEKVVIATANNCFRSITARKNFIENHKKKKEICDFIINQLHPTERIITFGNSTAFCDSLIHDSSTHYHSNIKGNLLKDGKVVGRYDDEYFYIKNKIIPKTKDIKFKTVSGKTVSKHNLKDFIEGKYRILHSAKAVKEGLDVQDVTVGILTSTVTNPRDYVQTVGRIRGGGILYQLVFAKTVEEKKMKESQKGILTETITQKELERWTF